MLQMLCVRKVNDEHDGQTLPVLGSMLQASHVRAENDKTHNLRIMLL